MNATSEKELFRPTWATIDLGALAHNYDVIEKRLKGKAAIMAMVKADAYGHGAVPVSKTLEKCGVRALGVATVEEGVELRDSGIGVPILVMGVAPSCPKQMLEANLTPVVHSEDVLDALDACAAGAKRNTAVHLKVDTGMNRLGVRPEALGSLLSHLKRCRHLFVEGVMTHLAEADQSEMSARQLLLFLEARSSIEAALGPVKVWHIANSGAIMHGEPVEIPGANECWARPGLSLYGDADGSDFAGVELRPVMGLESRAVLLKEIPEGARVSYGGTFTTKRPTRIAIVPIGYADGYPWSVSGKASVLIRGRRAPVVGRVTMDMIIVDATDVPDVATNDGVVLIGRQGKEWITLREFAGWAGTITYEILCGISKRIPRIYKT